MDACCVFDVVPNAFVGLEFTEITCYDVVMADVNLPQLGGIDMIRVLRNVGVNIPLIVVADAESDLGFLHQDDMKAFVCGVLRKPFHAVELCDVIEKCVIRSDTARVSHQYSSLDANNSLKDLRCFIATVQDRLDQIEGFSLQSSAPAADLPVLDEDSHQQTV